MARKKKGTNRLRVCVLHTDTDEELIIRANPSEEEVIGFVIESNRRHKAGEPAGPSGIPAFHIVGQAEFYPSEYESRTAEHPEATLDVSKY